MISTVDPGVRASRTRLGAIWIFSSTPIAYSDKSELKGYFYADTSRENFIRTLVISCFSFTEAARRAASR